MSSLKRFARIAPFTCFLVSAAYGAPVDYARDIQPLFEKHCYECHGPDKQKNGYRLDRRSVAFGGLSRHNIVPGNSQTSRAYLRVLDSRFGVRMPPDEPLDEPEMELIRRWIDEGAQWPMALANESPPPPLDVPAVDFVERLRAAGGAPESLRALRTELSKEPGLLNLRGPGGGTPLMFIALFGDRGLLAAALNAGGDPTRHNDAGATALHWAVDDVEKVRLLLDHGAPVDAISGIGRTALMIAAAIPRNAEVVALLLERGAKPTQAALSTAARTDVAIVRTLLAAGAKDRGGEAADAALRSNCTECLAVLAPAGARMPRAMLDVLPMNRPGDPAEMTGALERGADLSLLDAKGRSPLILAAISETVTPGVLKLLIDRGVNLQLRDYTGRNALDHALRVGRQPVIDALTEAGLTPTSVVAPARTYVADNTPRAAVSRSLPLLQTSSATFYERGGCMSCHHNMLTAMTVATARGRGFEVDDSMARVELATAVTDIDATRELALQGGFTPGELNITSGYLLMALQAMGQPPTLSTDAVVRSLRHAQQPDGHWKTFIRPPMEGSEFTATAVSVRGIRLYGARDEANRRSVESARRWLEATVPRNTEDRIFRLFGLAWADASPAARRAAIAELLSHQRTDGGWAQLPERASDAYATGGALVALSIAGLARNTAEWKRGVRFLLDTQLPDGSWLVRSRTHAGQSYFESGFPHGEDQFISAAATNWATQALTLASP